MKVLAHQRFTLDELTEILTLMQTRKIDRHIRESIQR